VAKWKKTRAKLPKNSIWKASPGYKIFVADRGAVRFDVPRHWLMEIEHPTVKFHDKKPPDDDCRLQATVWQFPPTDWTGLPITEMMGDADRDATSDTMLETVRDPFVELQRGQTEIVWQETRYLDGTQDRRPAVSRQLFARRPEVGLLITFDFWEDDRTRMLTCWDELVRSLRLGEYVKDPLAQQFRPPGMARN